MVHPSQVIDAAKEVDEIFQSVMEKLTGSHLPKQQGALRCACCPTVEGFNTNIPGLATTFQQLTISLPLKLGGFGLRGQEFLTPYGSVSPGRGKCLFNVLFFFQSRRVVWLNQTILTTSVDLW